MPRKSLIRLVSPLCILVCVSDCLHTNAFSTLPTNTGIEVRVCSDRDCITDGANEAKKLLESLVKKKSSKACVKITRCGCLGPCGKGPNVDVQIDGVRIKDARPGRRANVWCGIDSIPVANTMLQAVGVQIPERELESSDLEVQIESTRTLFNPDRTTRIALQRLLYACVLLPIVDAKQHGTLDVIDGTVYPNSYAFFALLIFIGSQFMGTNSRVPSVEVGGDDVRL